MYKPRVIPVYKLIELLKIYEEYTICPNQVGNLNIFDKDGCWIAWVDIVEENIKLINSKNYE